MMILVILVALAACSGPAPTLETAATPTPGVVAATSPPPANTPDLAATATPTPTTPQASTPGATSLPPVQDQESVISNLSEAELACIGGDPERMIAALTGAHPRPWRSRPGS